MPKKIETEEQEALETAVEAKIADPARPVLTNPVRATDLEMLSHQFQEGSPAHDMRDPASALRYGGGSEDNLTAVRARMDQEAEDAKDAKAKFEYVSQDEWNRRTKLDVGNPEYINPSLDHFKVK